MLCVTRHFRSLLAALRKVLPPHWKGEDTPLTLAFPDCRVGGFFFFFCMYLAFCVYFVCFSCHEQGCSVAPLLFFPPSHNSDSRVYSSTFLLLKKQHCTCKICGATRNGITVASQVPCAGSRYCACGSGRGGDGSGTSGNLPPV